MMKFSQVEVEHLFKAWIAISLAFAILLSNGDIFSSIFTTMLIVSGFTVGLGFLLHELGHKFMAQRYNCFAEFRAFNGMLILAIAMSFIGFVFAAPGAVMINGYINKEKNGKISVAGPAVNLMLGVIFLALILFGFVNLFTQYGLLINAWLAAFNMIPFMNLDGKKILNWSKPVYYSVLGSAAALLLASGFV
jgi:Zn-dependent protease